MENEANDDSKKDKEMKKEGRKDKQKMRGMKGKKNRN
jgi:hypothetical protein